MTASAAGSDVVLRWRGAVTYLDSCRFSATENAGLIHVYDLEQAPTP